jgi:hypothetical protein
VQSASLVLSVTRRLIHSGQIDQRCTILRRYPGNHAIAARGIVFSGIFSEAGWFLQIDIKGREGEDFAFVDADGTTPAHLRRLPPGPLISLAALVTSVRMSWLRIRRP